ncbi:unnamed protein product [Prunus armeniaca]
MVICQVRCFKTDLSLSLPPLRPSPFPPPPRFSPPAVASSSHQHRYTPWPATGPVRLGPPSAQPSVPPHPSPRQQLRPLETAREQPVFDRTFELSFSVVRPPNRTSEITRSWIQSLAGFQVEIPATSGQFLGHHALPESVAVPGQQGGDQKLLDSYFVILPHWRGLTNGPLRPARNATRMDLVSSGPARIVAQIEVLSLRPARNAAWLTLCFQYLRGWN